MEGILSERELCAPTKDCAINRMMGLRIVKNGEVVAHYFEIVGAVNRGV